jgi:RNA polymerase sigma factor (sigma-70 family)
MHTDATRPAARVEPFACTAITHGLDPADIAFARGIAREVVAHYRSKPVCRLMRIKPVDVIPEEVEAAAVRSLAAVSQTVFAGWWHYFARLACERTARLLVNRRWAKGAARGIRKHYRFHGGSQEEKELEAVAYLALVRCSEAFRPSLVPDGGDAEGLFRGWCHPFIRGECQREARRLRNGGTYHTRRETGVAPVMVEELPRKRSEIDGSEYVDVTDHRTEEEEESVTGPADMALAGELLASLDPNERLALQLRFGVGCGYCHTDREIAEALGVTKEQVAEVERSAFAKLRGTFPRTCAAQPTTSEAVA